jgi:hypothetical protein
MEKRNINNNLCECYCENFGYSVWVQSDETGLWFNLNDIFKTFPLKEFDKRDIKKSLTLNETEIYITFNRDNGEGDVYEAFISESVVHYVIALSKKATFQAENFIYDIIKDYDVTCVNINQQKLNTGQRIALHALKHEAEHHKEVTEHYMKMLKDNTQIPEKFEEYKNEIDKEVEDIKVYKPSYDNNLVPNEVRRNNAIDKRNEALRKGYERVNGSNLEKAVENIKRLNGLYADKTTRFDEWCTGNHLNYDEPIEWDDALDVINDIIDAFNKLDEEEIIDEDIIELDWNELL